MTATSDYLNKPRRTMADVINLGAARQVKPQHRTCPFCGTEPPLAAQIGRRFVVACEAEDCRVDVQASADSLEAVWAAWDGRP